MAPVRSYQSPLDELFERLEIGVDFLYLGGNEQGLMTPDEVRMDWS